MRVRTAIKKMVALGTGLTMVGATMFGAMAASSLEKFPAPFVSGGTSDFTIVLGETAKTEDVISAIDIAAALQAANVVSTPVAGGSSSVTVDNGVKFATSSTKLRYADALSAVKATLTKADLALLATKQVTGTDGNVYDMRFEITSPTTNAVAYGKSVLDATSPVLFYDWTTNDKNYTATIKFPTIVNLTLLAGKDIELFGKKFTVGTDSEQSGSKLTLYSSGTEVTVDKGTPATVGTSTIEITGINAAATTTKATLKVNGKSATVQAGNTYTIGDPAVRVYVKDILVYDSTSGGAVLFIGADKVVLEDGQRVTTGTSNTEVTGTMVDFNAGGTTAAKTSQIDIAVTPSSFSPDPKGTKVGESIADPVFKTFKWFFHSFSPALDDSSREDIVFSASDKELKLSAPLTTGTLSNQVVLRGNDSPSTGNETYLSGPNSKRIWTQASTLIAENDFFILSDGRSNSRLLRLDSVRNGTSSTNQYVTVTDVASGSATGGTWSHNGASGTMTYDGMSYTFTISGDQGTMSFATGATDGSAAGIANYLYTAKGAKITLPTSANGRVTSEFTVKEKTSYNEDQNPDDHGQLNFSVTYLESRTGNDVSLSTGPTYDATAGAAWSGLVVDGDGTYPQKAVTPFGTYVETNGDSNTQTKVAYKYAGKQAEVNFFLAPTESAATTSVTGTSTDKVVKLPVGFAQLDTEVASTWKTANTIVVGGPCVNSVAVSLLSSGTDCTAGFAANEAMIKLFEQTDGKHVSLLVAGLSALDTKRAARVLNDYKTYQAAGTLKGTSVVVKGTSLADTKVEAGK